MPAPREAAPLHDLSKGAGGRDRITRFDGEAEAAPLTLRARVFQEGHGGDARHPNIEDP
ncbi:hypothetical protein [Streptomyces sp. NPDC095817]|uniref:hypothetical protein n=1 Tax=unclassified Streptomyces TaxID=2593676 RepID=UPI00331F5677